MKDCIEGMSMLPDHSFDAIICDLPYGSTRNKWDTVIPFDELWEQYTRLVKERGAIILFGQGMFTAQLMTSNPRWWRYNLIWEKTQPTGFLNSHKMPLRAHEDICVFYKSLPEYHPIMTKGVRKVSSAVSKRNSVKSSNYGEHQHTDYDSELRYPTSVIRFPKDIQHSAIHPTQKPVALMEWLIRTYTKPGDVILDNCMGSGTTAIACISTGRRYVGFENDERYWRCAEQRIAEFRKTRESETNNMFNPINGIENDKRDPIRKQKGRHR